MAVADAVSDCRSAVADKPIRIGTPDWEIPFHLAMIGTTLAVAAVSLLGHFYFGLHLDPRACLPLVGMLAVLALVAAQYAWRGEARCFGVVMMVIWVVLITNCHFFPMYMAARTDVPMCDEVLARCDRSLGIEVPKVRAALAGYPTWNALLLVTYGTLIPLMTAATIVPPLLNRMDLSKRFIVGSIIAATISLPIFAVVQAVGPWEHYDFPPAIDSLEAKSQILSTLKTDQPFVIDITNRDGLITFPSFHVVLTVLAAVTLWPIRWLRWPATIWAALIVVSTVTTGIHYTIDVLGGLGLAVTAHSGAKVLCGDRPLAWPNHLRRLCSSSRCTLPTMLR